MALPKAVEEAAKKADELLLKMQQPLEDGKTDEAPVEKVEAKSEDVTPAEEKKEELAPVKTDEAKQPEVDLTEYERLKAEHEKLKQQHTVLKGKYDAEVPRLHMTVKALEAKLAERESTAQPDGAKPKNLDGVLKKLSDDYGEDFANNVQTAIDEKVAAAISGLKSDVESVKSTVTSSREEKFLAELTGLVPTWREIFKDPEFGGTYLEGVDPMSGRVLRELALEANKNMDAKRLALFYNGYLSSTKGDSTPAKTEVVKDKREGLIAPNGSSKGSSEKVGEKPDYIKASDMEKFYRDVTRGVYSYRPKEKLAMEERINAALAKGWIV